MLSINPDKKTILITGGNKGIGLAIAEKFASEGYNVFISARDEDTLKQVAATLRKKYSVYVNYFKCDVTSDSEISSMIANIASHSSIDVLVNNAGVHETKSFIDYEFDDFKRVIDTNL